MSSTANQVWEAISKRTSVSPLSKQEGHRCC